MENSMLAGTMNGTGISEGLADELGIDWRENELLCEEFREADAALAAAKAGRDQEGGADDGRR